jgi:hypothetical protein
MQVLSEYQGAQGRRAHVLEQDHDQGYLVQYFQDGEDSLSDSFPTESEAEDHAEDWVLGSTAIASTANDSGGCGCGGQAK